MATTTLPRTVYFFAGAGDLAADRLKKLASQAPEIQARANELPQELRKLAAEFPTELQKFANELPAELQKFATDLPSIAAQLQAKARQIDIDEVRAAVKKNVETAQHRAAGVYSDLVERGQKVVAKRDETPTTAATPAVATTTPAERKPAAKKAVAKKAPAKPVESN